MAKKAEKDEKATRVQTGSWLYRNMNFVFFLAFLTLLYIGNGHSAESKIREIHKLKDEVKELRSEYIFLESEIMYNSTPSQMANRIEGMELSSHVGMPRRLKAVVEDR